MLSADLLKRLYPSAEAPNIAAFSAQSDEVLGRFGILDKRDRLFFFLAQLGHESGGLHVHAENLNYSAARLRVVWPSRFPTLASTEGFAGNPEALGNKVYGGRLGNDAPGDGFRFRGRGYIQITGKDGYAEVGKRAGLNLVGSPDLATDPTNCLLIACAFWEWKNINPICDRGDFVAVTKRINGGTVGLQDRFGWLQKVQSIVPWPLTGASAAAVAAPDDEEATLPVGRIEAVQTKLKDLGLYLGSIDGVFGQNSRKALSIFQVENGLRKTGHIDAATLAKLGV